MKHLLSTADLEPRRRRPDPRHRRVDGGDAGPRDQEAAHAARPHRRQPLLRGLHPHAHLVRDGRQAAVGGRHQLLGQGVERVQGRVAQGHRADPAGHGRRRGRHPAPRLRRAAHARHERLDARRRHQRGRRDAPAPDAGAARRVHAAPPPDRPGRRHRPRPGRACASRSSATCCTAGSPAPTCSCCTRSAPRSRSSRRPRCCPSGSRPGRPRCRTTWTRSIADDKPDAMMMLRVQRERMSSAGGGFFPSPLEYTRRYGLDARRLRRAAGPRDRPAPRPDEPRPGDLRRRGRLAARRDRRAGGQRRRGPHGRPVPPAGGRRRPALEHADARPTRRR